MNFNQTNFIENANLFLSYLSHNETSPKFTLPHRNLSLTSNTSSLSNINNNNKEFIGKNKKTYGASLLKMFIRAWSINEDEHFISRYQKFCALSQTDLKQMAKLVTQFQNFHRSLLSKGIPFLETLNSPQGRVNRFFPERTLKADLHNNLDKLKLIMQDINKIDSLIDRYPINIRINYETKVASHDLREKRTLLIKKIIAEIEAIQINCLSHKLHLEQSLNFGLEIYNFFQSLLFMKNTKELGINIKDTLLEAITIIATDKGMPVKKCLSFGFPFKFNNNELIETLKYATHQEDLIFINNLNHPHHGIILIRHSHDWQLIDPNHSIIPQTINDWDVTSKIYTSLSIQNSEPAPIVFHIIEKHCKTYLPRPDEKAIFNNIFSSRAKENSQLNYDTKHMALNIAIRLDNVKLADALIKCGATSTLEQVKSCQSKEMKNKLATGGIWSFIKRNWKTTLLATLITTIAIIGCVLTSGALAAIVPCVLFSISICFIPALPLTLGANYYLESSKTQDTNTSTKEIMNTQSTQKKRDALSEIYKRLGSNPYKPPHSISKSNKINDSKPTQYVPAISTSDYKENIIRRSIGVNA